MAKGFTLAVLPWVYIAKHGEDGKWSGKYTEKPHKTPEEEASMSEEEKAHLHEQRNSFPELPLVNYTTQYGMGCFEGLKAFPQKDGNIKLFRPDRNGQRMHDSLIGLKSPAFPVDMFVEAAKGIVKRNKDLGFAPSYNSEWEKDDFQAGESVYIRPFSYSEPAIGLGVSEHPWVVFVSTEVGAYFKPGSHAAKVTDKLRAFRGGTGWIKCDANYVVPILAKKEAEAEGYMEAVFLDAEKRTYLEEGSSSNIFVLLKDGTLVTPELGDTILPGITRSSLLTLAQDMGVRTEERKITIEEAMENGKECFVSGTAAGLSYIESITHRGKTVEFNNRKMGELSQQLLNTLKGIQYGKVEDTHGWMYPVE
ncbi:MAG: aminotransferase class IV [Spirochaetia bacterium]